MITIRQHRHRADGYGGELRPWFACVRPDRCNGAAHGGVAWVYRCRCGAAKEVEVNGRHQTDGRWTA